MKRLLTFLAVSIAVVTAPATASAQDQSISGVCAFPIEVTYLANDEMARVTLPSGVVIQTGRFVVRITNADTGTSTDLNVSGPVFTDASGNGTYRGEALLFFGQTGELYLTSGTVVFGPTGVVRETGTRTNICDRLAG